MNILIIDDDIIIQKIFTEILEKEKHKVFAAEDGIKGYEYFNKEKIDICFLDLWMPKIGGIEVLKKIKKEYPNVEVIMISGQAKIDIAVKATKLGAYDFIEKPLSIYNIISIIKSIEIKKKEKKETINRELSQDDVLIGESQPIKAVKKLIENAAKSDARILITGENGTGKEIIAREIHLKSLRAVKPFIGVNCAAIPENLIESELFGHVKGSFTGATSDRIGKFELANTGTLFLDEIADMSLATQSKVLRVLQEMRVTKIGSVDSNDIDVRIIAASNKDIKNEIKDSRFREDLYYRLNVIPFYVPALRERKEDIELFINYFMTAISKQYNIKEKSISKDAVNYMINYSWPGNVRQLRNIIERLIIIVPRKDITLEDVKKHLDEEYTENSITDVESKYEKYKLNIAVDEFEKDFIEKKLIENNFNISKTSKALGIYSSNLYSKINKLGINVEKIKKLYYNKKS